MSELLRIPEAKLVLAGAGQDLWRYGDAIVREGVEMSGAEHTSVLMIPTAEPYADWYDETVGYTRDAFTEKLGIKVNVLHEFQEPPSQQHIDDMFGEATHISIAGGDTDEMLKFWAKYGITSKLQEAAKNGIPIIGGSAVAIMPLQRGHSDFREYHLEGGTENPDFDYEIIDCLGWIAAAGAPHFDSRLHGVKRGDDFIEKWRVDRLSPDIAIGFDNMAALAVRDGLYRVIQNPVAAIEKYAHEPNIHVLRRSEGDVRSEVLPVLEEYQPFDLVA